MNLPLAPVGATALGIAAAAAVALLPTPMLERVVWDSGLPALIAAAEPPLGMTARVLLAAGVGVAVAALSWFALFLLLGAAGVETRRRAKAEMAGGRRNTPFVRRADAHPDAPPRPPLRATVDLGMPFPDAGVPIGPADPVVPAEETARAAPETAEPVPESAPEVAEAQTVPAAESAPEKSVPVESVPVAEDAADTSPMAQPVATRSRPVSRPRDADGARGDAVIHLFPRSFTRGVEVEEEEEDAPVPTPILRPSELMSRATAAPVEQPLPRDLGQRLSAYDSGALADRPAAPVLRAVGVSDDASGDVPDMGALSGAPDAASTDTGPETPVAQDAATVPVEETPTPIVSETMAPVPVNSVPVEPVPVEPVSVAEPLATAPEPEAPAGVPPLSADVPLRRPVESVEPPVFAEGERFEAYELLRPEKGDAADEDADEPGVPTPIPAPRVPVDPEASIHALLERLEQGAARRGLTQADKPHQRGLEEALVTLRNLARNG